MLQLCRTCHGEIFTNDFIAINDNNVKSKNVKARLLSCIPELQQDLVKEPILCSACVDALQQVYTFIKQCFQTEERIRKYFLNTKISAKSVTLVELYKQAMKVSAPCISLELQDAAVKPLSIILDVNADDDADTKDVVVEEQELPYVKEEMCDTDDEYSVNIDNDVDSEDICNIPRDYNVENDDIVKEEHNITQFKVDEDNMEDNRVSDNELENLQSAGKQFKNVEEHSRFEYLGGVTKNTRKQIKECFVKLVRIEDLPQLQSGNGLKTTFSHARFTNQCGSTEAESSISGMKRKCLLTNNLSSHVVGNSEKPYKCNVCKFCTKTKRSLKGHLKTHTGEKTFSCTICEINAVCRSALNQHMRIHTGVKPFRCAICEYCTTQKGNLTRHTRTHTSEKPYRCNICKFRTAEKSTLKKHTITHTGEKPFQCTICEYNAARRSTLNKHMRTHTGVKPFQ